MNKVLAKFIFCLMVISSFSLKATDLFVSLKSSEVNMRVGPGKEYPIAWVFMRANLPMILMAEFDQWRKVKFIDGTVGWVHKNMISRKSSAIVTENYAIMYKHASKKHPIAKIEKGVVVRILKRDGDFVKADINNQKGWIEKKFLWGINED
jgi:SH3-like domain-containing protein